VKLRQTAAKVNRPTSLREGHTGWWVAVAVDCTVAMPWRGKAIITSMVQVVTTTPITIHNFTLKHTRDSQTVGRGKRVLN